MKMKRFLLIGRTKGYPTSFYPNHNPIRNQSKSISTSNNKSRIGIGGSRLSQNTTSDNPAVYASVIATSLQNGVTTFESGAHGKDGGEEKLARAYLDATSFLSQSSSDSSGIGDDFGDGTEVTFTARFGYRSVTIDDKDEESVVSSSSFPNDVLVEDNSTNENNLKEEITQSTSAEVLSSSRKEVVYHNISQPYLSSCIATSPLVQLRQQQLSQNQPNSNQKINLIYMAHNPEAQGSALLGKGAPLPEVRQHVKEHLTDAFVGLERAVVEEKVIDSYGVCSNGLSLPSSHPLHLSWEDVLESASKAVHLFHYGSFELNPKDNEDKESGGVPVANLSTLQLPANVMEAYGLKVSRLVKQYLASNDNPSKFPLLPYTISIHTTRPLTCYPDRGTGTGHPFKLVDYLIPTSLDDDPNLPKQWTHQITGSTPAHYTPALNAAMSHFDATHLLEQQQSQTLSPEELETLEGCRLLQSMLHDLDASLTSLRSLAAYQEELYTKVIPLIHDTFEELDEESTAVLTNFFKAHGFAARHAIARTTRDLVKKGGEGIEAYDSSKNKGNGMLGLEDDVSLQEFGLQFLLGQRFVEENDEVGGENDYKFLVDKVMVGCPQPEHVVEAIQAADKLAI